MVKGFEKSRKDSKMEIAFLAVVTVTATRAPYREMSASTACVPKKPDRDSTSIAGITQPIMQW